MPLSKSKQGKNLIYKILTNKVVGFLLRQPYLFIKGKICVKKLTNNAIWVTFIRFYSVFLTFFDNFATIINRLRCINLII